MPKANRVNELKPSLVVTVSSKEVLIDRTSVATFDEVKNSVEWTIPALRDQVRVILEKAKYDQETKLQNNWVLKILWN